MRELLPSWKRCGGVYWKGETTIAKKEIGLVYWKRTRHSHLWFVVLHLPLDLNATIMFSISTSGKTSSYMLWAPNQGRWISLMMDCRKEWLRTLKKNVAAIDIVFLRAQLKNIPAALLSASEYAWMRGCRRELHTRKKIWVKFSASMYAYAFDPCGGTTTKDILSPVCWWSLAFSCWWTVKSVVVTALQFRWWLCALPLVLRDKTPSVREF